LKKVFADTAYWVAIAKPDDPWGEEARKVSETLRSARIVTTDEVLAEFLTAVSRAGGAVRAEASEMARQILRNPNVTVMPQTRQSFLEGLDLYEKRRDKSYSLTDCISMNTMLSQGITEVLTTDTHFEQESLTRLLGRSG
jgi:predicted nucleic acid-binding protein